MPAVKAAGARERIVPSHNRPARDPKPLDRRIRDMRAIVALTATAALLAPAAAQASGGGLSAGFGGQGASAPGGPLTYIAVPAGRNRSVIQGINKDGGAVDRWRELPGM